MVAPGHMAGFLLCPGKEKSDARVNSNPHTLTRICPEPIAFDLSVKGIGAGYRLVFSAHMLI